MILTETVKVKWHYSNREYYQSILDENGKQKYFYTKDKDEIEIDFNEISEKSSVIIEVECDYCGNEETRIYRNWRYHFDISPVKKDACVRCRGKKTAESNLLIHGTANVMQIKEIQEKVETTNLERYGVKNAGGSQQAQDKIKQHNLDTYGVEYYFQTDEFKEQYVETMQDKYGVDNAFQAEEVKLKQRATMLENWGVEYNMQHPEIRAKAVETMYQKGSTPTSRPQIYLHQLFGGELNYPAEWYNLDIALVDERIVIEYDGGAHDLKVTLGGISAEDFKRREIIRGAYLKKNDWKLLTIKSKADNLPSENDLYRMLEDARSIFSQGRSWVTFCVDNQTIKYRDVELEYKFNKIEKYRDFIKRIAI